MMYLNGFNFFTEGLSEGASSSTEDASRAVVDRLPPTAVPPSTHTSPRPSSDKPGETHNFFAHFPKDPNFEIFKCIKIRRRAFDKRNLENRTDRLPKEKKIGIIERQLAKLSTKTQNLDYNKSIR